MCDMLAELTFRQTRGLIFLACMLTIAVGYWALKSDNKDYRD